MRPTAQRGDGTCTAIFMPEVTISQNIPKSMTSGKVRKIDWLNETATRHEPHTVVPSLSMVSGPNMARHLPSVSQPSTAPEPMPASRMPSAKDPPPSWSLAITGMSAASEPPNDPTSRQRMTTLRIGGLLTT